MDERRTRGIRAWDQALTWMSLIYGIYCAAYDAVHSRDELQIALGVELILVSLLDFMWARARRSLGLGLMVAGLSAPLIGFGSAPLFWYQVQVFSGQAFWTSMILGSVVGIPLIWLGRRTLTHAVSTEHAPDPRWLTPVRWALRGGLWLIVLAFQLGDFKSGTVLVYAGAALALASLGIGLPRRLAVGTRGVGKLFLFLGLGALVVTLVAGVAVGGHMSGDEALLGIVPALLLSAAGAFLMLRRAP